MLKTIIKNNIVKDFKKGFTLIELMVATTIFSVVALGAISILSASQSVYKRISATRNATDNLNMVMDAMTREIKFGTNYWCINSVSDGSFSRDGNPNYNSFSLLSEVGASCNAIAFLPQNQTTPAATVFYFDTKIQSINKVDYSYNSTTNYTKISDTPLTSSDLTVNTFLIKITGSKYTTDTDPDYLQPGVSIFMSGIINQNQNNFGTVATSTFSLESFVSQRLLDK